MGPDKEGGVDNYYVVNLEEWGKSTGMRFLTLHQSSLVPLTIRDNGL